MHNLEDISLKILRILYQLSESSKDYAINASVLEDRFSFTDTDAGKTLIQKSLQSLTLVGLVSQTQREGEHFYTISDRGKKFYEQFKYLQGFPQVPGNIIIQGNWTGNNQNYHLAGQDQAPKTFPGKSIEFLEHYTDIMKEIEQLSKLMHKKHKEPEIFEHITNIKNIINSNIENVEREFPWISKFEKLSSRIEKQLQVLTQYLQKNMAYQ